MDYRNGPVGTVDGAQKWESDGVVAAEGDDARQHLATFGRAKLVGIGHRRSRQQLVVAVFNLLKSPCIIIPYCGEYASQRLQNCMSYLRGHGNIAAVKHCRPAVEGIHSKRDIVTATVFGISRVLLLQTFSNLTRD